MSRGRFGGQAALVDLELMVHQWTEKAVLVSDDGNRRKAVWLPKSQVEFEEQLQLGKAQTMTLPEALAIEKGLV